MPAFSNDPRTESSLQHSLKDATAFATMTGIGETYLSAFALFLKASTPQIGLLASVPPMLASLVGVPYTTAAIKIERANGSVTVDREIEGGASEVVELQVPCLIAVQSGLNQVRYASLKGIMAAKKKPLDVKSVADLGISGQVGAGAAKVKVTNIAPPVKGDTAEIL